MDIKDENFVDDFARFLERQGVSVNQDVYKIIRKYLKNNSNEAGEILRTPKQVNSESRILLKRYFRSNNYQGFLGRFGTGFRKVLDSETYMQSSFNKITFTDSFIQNEMNPILTEFLKETKLLIGEIGFKTRLVSPVARALTIAVKKGLTIDQTEKVIKRLTIGTKSNKGDFLKYTQQVARDSIHGYDAQINTTIAKSYGLKNWIYIGSKVADSRCFCLFARTARIVTADNLPSLIKKAKNCKGKGKYLHKNLNIENIGKWRGGPNCRDRLFPTNNTN